MFIFVCLYVPYISIVFTKYDTIIYKKLRQFSSIEKNEVNVYIMFGSFPNVSCDIINKWKIYWKNT